MPKISIRVRNGDFRIESHCPEGSPNCYLVGLEKLGTVVSNIQEIKTNGKRKDRT